MHIKLSIDHVVVDHGADNDWESTDQVVERVDPELLTVRSTPCNVD